MTIRVGAQRTGTLAWELAAAKARGFAEAEGLDISVSWFASPDAGRIALLGGAVDVILGDWLWAARERALGEPLQFYPTSAALGGVMVREESGFRSLADLSGKTLGVAGGPIDKSWLLLQAYARREGLDLKRTVRPVFGAPALLYEKTLAGELDASLAFWTYAARLEAKGFRTLVGLEAAERRLGAQGPVALIGFLFRESFARTQGETLARFLTVIARAREALAGEAPQDWAAIGRELGISDPQELALFRRRYIEGFARRPVAEEEADARNFYAILREVGGAELVGPATALEPGLFYRGAPASGGR
ncbi:ABC transporter substrate-binding protein [Methylocella sp.]|uniref:ABC transporter substrate-binding protein n=1 Tax=Methylocella sp. TaxID=1978226 RepID=UPI003785094D